MRFLNGIEIGDGNAGTYKLSVSNGVLNIYLKDSSTFNLIQSISQDKIIYKEGLVSEYRHDISRLTVGDKRTKIINGNIVIETCTNDNPEQWQ